MTALPKLSWDIGTAYDLFVSLKVIHRPADYGLRASWAAGVRSRLPNKLREALELSNAILHIPMHWLHTLPEPKNASVVLQGLAAIPPAERLPILFFPPDADNDYKEILSSSAHKEHWSSAEFKVLREAYKSPYRKSPANLIEQLFSAWSEPERFGENLLSAIKVYIESFFDEEEQRIIPALKEGLALAQARAQSLALPALLEELSLGVRFEEVLNVSALVLAPSFWGAPFLFYDHLDADTYMLLFGARPDDCTLVPGDIVPESLLRGLKALADPTRLRILRSLNKGPQTPTQLAHILRLRAPTVIHHLHALRLAGLVQVTVSSHGERNYSARFEGFDSTQEILQKFINGD